MDLTPANLSMLYTGFRANFQAGFAGIAPEWREIAMEVPSSTASNTYGWMGDLPEVREWVGERVVHELNAYGYTLANRRFELTVGVDVDQIDDDQYGIYAPIVTEFGASVGRFPNRLVMSILKAGTTAGIATGYDGVPLLSAQHPRLDANGKKANVSNWDGGNGTPWFLVDLSRAIKPLVYQPRRAFDFVRLDKSTDECVFQDNRIIYGTKGRCNAGPGFWQLLRGSAQPLNPASFASNLAAFESLTFERSTDNAGVRATHLVVPPALEAAARQVVEADLVPQAVDGGGTVAVSNVWKGRVKLLLLRSLG